MSLKQVIEIARFSLALKPVVSAMVRDLYHLTSGNVPESTAVIHRFRDEGYRLDEARRDVDARLERIASKKPS